MRKSLRKKCRHRRLSLRDRRGLRARRISVHCASRSFGLLMYWVKCNGICVLTEAGKPAFVLVDPRRYAALSERVGAIVAVAAARARNPGGLFTLADEVFGTHVLADWWMAQENGSLAGMRPVEKLSTEQGLEEVLDVLRRIQHGMFA